MRESKSFEERLQELKDKYEPINDFDLIAVLKLEDEHDYLLRKNPEHTKRRRDILDMRYRLLSNLRLKPKDVKKDIYVDVNKDKCTMYFNGAAYFVTASRFDSTTDMVDYVASFLKSQSDNTNIYVDHHAYGVMLARILDEEDVEYSKMKIERV